LNPRKINLNSFRIEAICGVKLSYMLIKTYALFLLASLSHLQCVLTLSYCQWVSVCLSVDCTKYRGRLYHLEQSSIRFALVYL